MVCLDELEPVVMSADTAQEASNVVNAVASTFCYKSALIGGALGFVVGAVTVYGANASKADEKECNKHH